MAIIKGDGLLKSIIGKHYKANGTTKSDGLLKSIVQNYMVDGSKEMGPRNP